MMDAWGVDSRYENSFLRQKHRPFGDLGAFMSIYDPDNFREKLYYCEWILRYNEASVPTQGSQTI
jgi:hypothetical protein